MNFDDSYIAVGPYLASLEWANDRIETVAVETQVEALHFVYRPDLSCGTRTSSIYRRIFDARGQLIYLYTDPSPHPLGDHTMRCTVELVRTLGDCPGVTPWLISAFEMVLALSPVFEEIPWTAEQLANR